MILITLLALFFVKACAHTVVSRDIDNDLVNNSGILATPDVSSKAVIPDFNTGLKRRSLRVGPYSEARQALPGIIAPVVQVTCTLFIKIVKVVSL